MNSDVKTVLVNVDNVAGERFFCYKSKPKSEGYQDKLNWLLARFAEGLKIRQLYAGKRSVGFVEYIPGEFAWRAVNAPDYLLIHCIWVVGQAKGQGFASRLLDECVQDAQQMQKSGVAMVVSSGNWLAGKKLLLKNGFQAVDQAPPSFELLVRPLDDAPLPSFPQDWEARLARLGAGLTLLHSPQCPYTPMAVQNVREAAAEAGLTLQEIKLTSSQQVQQMSPSAYGTFGLVYNGRLLSYHWLGKKELLDLLQEMPA